MSEHTYEKLLTLAKQDYDRRVKEYNFSELDELLYKSMKYVDMTPRQRRLYVARRVFRPALNEYNRRPDECLEYLQRTCGDSWNLQIELEPDNQDESCKTEGPKDALRKVMKVTFQLTPSAIGTVYGFLGYKNRKLDVTYNSLPGINVVDLGYFFAGLYLYSEIRRELDRISSLSPYERESDEHYKSVIKYFEEYQKKRGVKFTLIDEERLSYCKKIIAEAERETSYNKYEEMRVDMEVHYYLFQLMMNREWPMVEYVDLVTYSLSKRKGWQTLGYKNDPFYPFTHFEILQNAIVEERGRVLSNYKRYAELTSDYAKSFTTKKNRSKKLIEQTEASSLWKYFGYVEYDADVEIDAVRKYETEFETFYQKYLSDINLSEHAIRFRKLGQHHVAGLYYPNVKCLCVDLHHPHSMVHELGHLIDYMMGGLSAQKEFSTLYRETKDYLETLSKRDDKLGEMLQKKSKYNLNYYLTPTEMFARGFELYVYYILNERSNLLREEYGGVYNTSNEYIQLVREYFQKVFKEM